MPDMTQPRTRRVKPDEAEESLIEAVRAVRRFMSLAKLRKNRFREHNTCIYGQTKWQAWS